MVVGRYRPIDLALTDHPLKSVKQDLLVHQAWVHLWAMDFAGAIAICEPILALPKETVLSATLRFLRSAGRFGRSGLGK
jgi:hypothetical protein